MGTGREYLLPLLLGFVRAHTVLDANYVKVAVSLRNLAVCSLS